jgi:hypothetical protein
MPHSLSPQFIALSHESTVPRHLVHRAAVAEVLITDWQRTGEHTFTVAAQWPPGHLVYGSRGGQFDSMLAAETIRQAGILLAHVGYGVPHGWAFVMQRLRFSCTPDRLRVTACPLNLTATVQIGELVRRGTALRSMRVDLEIIRDGEPLAVGSGWVYCVPPAVFARLRRRDPARPARPPQVPPAEPAAVGRQRPEDVVIGPRGSGGTHPLRILLDHPVFFDHPLDHVPGMLAIEALRQAALIAAGRPRLAVTGVDATFPAFLELDRPCEVGVDTLLTTEDGHLARVSCVQQGVTGVCGELTLSEVRPRPGCI